MERNMSKEIGGIFKMERHNRFVRELHSAYRRDAGKDKSIIMKSEIGDTDFDNLQNELQRKFDELFGPIED